MNPPNPAAYLVTQGSFAALTLLCLALVLRGLWLTLASMGYPPARRKRVVFFTAAGLAAWLAYTAALSLTGLAGDFSSFPPPMMPLVLLPPLVVALVLTFSGRFGVVLRHVPVQWLLSLQSFRVAVEVLLWALHGQGLLPVQMTFEGLNFDVLTGITAPLAAYLVTTRPRWRRPILLGWNLAGLALLATIVVISILSLPTPLRAFPNEPANTIVTRFPFSWLPGFLVPLAYTLHFFALRKLITNYELQMTTAGHGNRSLTGTNQ
ncbi:MAG: hypothetical protein ICV83_26190 [Cytophagales bacterium]|nr:hypothetical protein [Cytophagales bacterium]